MKIGTIIIKTRILMKADLHIHSSCSADGELGIPAIMDLCEESGTGLFSITDHNGIRGAREAKERCSANTGLTFIPGIEIDCNYQGTDLHLLGYHVDVSSLDFDTLEKKVNHQYMDATPRMIRNLAKLGIEIDTDAVMHKAGDKPPTGELIAEVLLMQPEQQANPALQAYLPGGERSDMPLINFYLDYLAQGKPAHVEIQHMDFSEALDLVQDNGGIPVVAHPGLNLEGRETIVGDLLELGARGLEVFNNYHSPGQIAWFAGFAKEKGTLMTCGSDFHGKNKPRISIGQYSFLEHYREYLERSLMTIMKQDGKNSIR
jgi:predicted metal-dependent phosphoesterase TrpH